MRRIMGRFSIKLILMSATIEPEKFSQYYSACLNGAIIPHVFVGSGCFDVAEFYLDDILQICPQENATARKIMTQPAKPSVTDTRRNFIIEFIFKYVILNKFLPFRKHQMLDPVNSFLIFLPGIQDIDWLYEGIESRNQSIEIHILHSMITTEEQQTIFLPAPEGKRKIMLATNIAESSITIPDVSVVIDFCLTKNMVWDSVTQCQSLNEFWISKDSAKQRKGRAGRVKEGECYRVITKQEWEGLRSTVIPQIQQEPLDRLVLRILQNPKWDDPAKVLSKKNQILKIYFYKGECIDPPNLATLATAYSTLFRIGAVTGTEQHLKITNLGQLLGSLPVDTNSGMLIVFGYAFGYLTECVAIAGVIARYNITYIS
jgi:HrpA-like RNA helicase